MQISKHHLTENRKVPWAASPNTEETAYWHWNWTNDGTANDQWYTDSHKSESLAKFSETAINHQVCASDITRIRVLK